jgi:hypothetical protein
MDEIWQQQQEEAQERDSEECAWWFQCGMQQQYESEYNSYLDKTSNGNPAPVSPVSTKGE